MDGTMRAMLWSVTLAVHGTVVLSSGLPLLNDEDVRVKNLTDSSVVLTWEPVQVSDLSQYRLMVSYQRQGYNIMYMEAAVSDPDCSLRLSHCHLTALFPNTLYSVSITIDLRQNNTLELLGRADLFFSTSARTENVNDKDLQWWLMFVVGPAVGGLILLILIIIIAARCCGCCCWSKTMPIQQSTKSFSSTSSSQRVLRSESHATREWVQDTFRTAQPEPPPTYDRPMYSPTLSPSQREPQHCYLQMNERTIPRTAPPVSPRSPESHQGCHPFSGRQRAEKAGHSPTSYINVSGDKGQTTINRHNQGTEPELPHRSCPPLQQPRKGKHEQVIYANTEDVNKLLGSAKKMFPML